MKIKHDDLAQEIRRAAMNFGEEITIECAAAIAREIVGTPPCLPDELWAPIPDCPGYEASSLGRIRSLTRLEADGRGSNRLRLGRILKQHPATPPRLPYMRVGVFVGGRPATRSVARLVCAAFHGLPPSADMHTAHLDNNCQNNAAANLAWTTVSENLSHQLIWGTRPRGSQKKMATINEDTVRVIRSLVSPNFRARKIANALGISTSVVHGVITGKTWKHVQ